jgi:CRISPR/Cas system-associated protein Csx1
MIKKVKFKNPRVLDKLSRDLKVLVATWGNPAEWRETNYLLDSECEKGKTSLKLIKRKVNPDKTILIGLDTLAREGSTYEEVRSSARNIYMRHYEASGRTRYSIR